MKTLGLIALIALLVSCKKSHKEDTRFYGNAVKFTDNEFASADLPLQVQKTDPKIGPVKHFTFLKDGYIVIDSSQSIIILDKDFNERQRFNEKISPGLKQIAPHDIISVNSNEFFVYDLTMDKLSDFVFNKQKDIWEFQRSIPLIEDFHGLVSMDNRSDLFVATSLNNIHGKLITFTISPQQKINKYIGYVPDYPDQNKYMTGMEYRSACTYDSISRQIFVGHFFTDLLEAYDLQGKLKFRIQGPENFQPLFKVKKQGDFQIFVNSMNTKSAYLSLTSDDKYLYALYSGKSIKEQNINDDNTIYIFHKSGKAYKKIILDKNFSGIKVDNNSHKLYCFNFTKNATKNYLFYFDVSNL